MKQPKEKPRVRLEFPKDGKVQPKGFDGVGVNDQVTVVLKGTIKEVSENAESWNPGKQMLLHVTACEIKGQAQGPVSLDAAIKAGQAKV